MVEATPEQLHEAIARNSAAVLSLPTDGALRHHKTRFLAADEVGFWVEAIPGQDTLVEELIQQQRSVGIAFKSSTNRIVFVSFICQQQPQFKVNRQLTLNALLLAFPETVKAVQRRSAYRVHVPTHAGLMVRAWRIAEHAVLRDRPSATLELSVQVRDISVGGIGLLLPPKDGQPQRITPQQRLRIVVQYGEQEALMEGRVQHIKPTPDQSLRLGVQFQKTESNLEGRQALAKLTSVVGQLQRDEVRRIRLGMTA